MGRVLVGCVRVACVRPTYQPRDAKRRQELGERKVVGEALVTIEEADDGLAVLELLLLLREHKIRLHRVRATQNFGVHCVVPPLVTLSAEARAGENVGSEGGDDETDGRAARGRPKA